MLWYAFQFDIKATDGNREIAAGLDSTATFDQFINYIQHSNTPPFPDQGPTSVGDNRTPDVTEIGRELSQRGYRNNYDIAKLFGQGRFTNARIGFQNFATVAVDRVQTVRPQLVNEDVSDILEGTRNSIIGLYQESQIWDSPLVLEALAEYLGYKPAMKTVLALDGTPFDGLDPEETVNQHPDFYDKYDEFQDMLSKVAHRHKYYRARLRFKNIRTLAEFDESLQSSC